MQYLACLSMVIAIVEGIEYTILLAMKPVCQNVRWITYLLGYRQISKNQAKGMGLPL